MKPIYLASTVLIELQAKLRGFLILNSFAVVILNACVLLDYFVVLFN